MMSTICQPIRFFVRKLTGQTWPIATSIEMVTVEDLKKEVARVGGPAVSRQRLIFFGKEMRNDDLLDSFGMQRETTIHLVEMDPTDELNDKDIENASSQTTPQAATPEPTPSAETLAALGTLKKLEQDLHDRKEELRVTNGHLRAVQKELDAAYETIAELTTEGRTRDAQYKFQLQDYKQRESKLKAQVAESAISVARLRALVEEGAKREKVLQQNHLAASEKQEKELIDLRYDNKSLNEDAEAYEEEISKLKEDICELDRAAIDDAAAMAAKLDAVQARARAAEEITKDVQDQNNLLIEQIEEHRENTDHLTRALRGSRAEAEDLKREVKELEDVIEGQTKETTMLQDHVKQLQLGNDILVKENRQAKDVRGGLDVLRVGYESLQERNAKLVAELDQLRLQEAAAQRVRAGAAGDLVNCFKHNQRLDSEVTRLKNLLVEANRVKVAAEKARDEAQANEQRVRSDILEEVYGARSELEDAKAEAADAKAEASNAKAEASNAKAEASNAKAEAADAKAEAADAKAEAADAKAEAADAKAEAADAKAEAADAKAEAADAKAQIGALEMDLHDAAIDARLHDVQLEEYCERIAELEATLIAQKMEFRAQMEEVRARHGREVMAISGRVVGFSSVGASDKTRAALKRCLEYVSGVAQTTTEVKVSKEEWKKQVVEGILSGSMLAAQEDKDEMYDAVLVAVAATTRVCAAALASSDR